MDLWDWLEGLVGWLFELLPGFWLWLLILTAALVVWWLYVPYFHV